MLVENLTPADILNGGVNVVTVYLVLRVMNRLDALTDRILTYLENAASQRAALLKAQGIKPEDVS